ncbi:MAG: preprotein translocase subunit SecG [Muribaculaceae bacterium]|nr:preprotein translocase subunit SecG [Muribaculaceae bacterium]MDE6321133.1 preprotein translocase subunit SecG [Muribaculaceae bacterium]
MYTLVIVLTVIVAILLIGVVLVQKSKGGGLASGFSGANQIMGVRHTNDFIEKTTWVLAAIVAVLAVISVFVMPKANTSGSRVKAPVEQAAPVQNAPNDQAGQQQNDAQQPAADNGAQGEAAQQPANNGEGEGA